MRVWPLLLLASCTLDLQRPQAGDAGSPDQGPPEPSIPCSFDQGSVEAGACPNGLVCDVLERRCVPGTACVSDADCEACRSEGCGHGLALEAWCDFDHGAEEGVGICTRSRAPCERCREGQGDCGRVALIPGGPFYPAECAEVGDGFYCTRPCFEAIDCSTGFVPFRCLDVGPDFPGRCERRLGCPAAVDFCPLAEEAEPPRQIGALQPCEAGRCETSQWDGTLGICLGDCGEDADCPLADGDPNETICQLRSGLCERPCEVGECTGPGEPPQVCQEDGRCGLPCWIPGEDAPDVSAAVLDQRCRDRGLGARCNVPPPSPGQPRRESYEGLPLLVDREDFACVPRGCWRNEDCWASFGEGRPICDLAHPIGEGEESFAVCVAGCQSLSDCAADESCRIGATDERPSLAECGGLFDLDPNRPEAVGICCPVAP
ncbi:MAG: hypothetical protein AAGD10_05730 [Myxococcota bacterium]